VALPSHIWPACGSFDHSPSDLVIELPPLDSQTGRGRTHNWWENTAVLLSIFPRCISYIASMSDAMEIDDREPRGTKRTADEAGLPREAPRRIKPLDKDVVNKIAAGEIIVAPMHALVSSLYDA
jgi:hypothetical protein